MDLSFANLSMRYDTSDLRNVPFEGKGYDEWRTSNHLASSADAPLELAMQMHPY